MRSLKLHLVTALVALGTVAGSVRGETFFSYASFTGTNGDIPGANPYSGLALGPDGDLYGTTSAGGSNNLGTIFRVTPAGAITSVFSFNGTNGANPYAALLKGNDGNLYGTTFMGGVSNWGTIFMMTTNGDVTNLFSFTGSPTPTNGANPSAGLTLAPDGSFYGTADYGGTTNPAEQGLGFGTIFQFSNGTVSVPVALENTDGAHPSGGVVLGRDGNYYGTTTWGGKGLNNETFLPGFGTIFKLMPDGTFTNIYQFTGGVDGGFIYGGVVQGDDGYLYGAAFSGGVVSGASYGTLFKVSTNGTYIPLHVFSPADLSSSPYGGMMEGNDGNFYGTTYGTSPGSGVGYGSVFSVTPDGAFTNLFIFSETNGLQPVGVLVQGADNNFYGTTAVGGANNLGTIFRLSVPLPPVITTLAQSNGLLSLTWRAVAQQTYQVQSLDDLTQTNWESLTPPATATGGSMTATNIDSLSSARRFYRVVLE